MTVPTVPNVDREVLREAIQAAVEHGGVRNERDQLPSQKAG